MKQVLIIAICTLITTCTFGESLLSVKGVCENNLPGLNTHQGISTSKKKLNFKKLSFKERLIWKWLEKKFNKRGNGKNPVNELGFASLIFSVIAVASILILLIADLEALLGLLAVGLLAGLAALILGIFSLAKRSKLKDQTGTKAWPAIVGIILSILLGILLALLLVG